MLGGAGRFSLAPPGETGKWPRTVVRGYFQYHAPPGNRHPYRYPKPWLRRAGPTPSKPVSFCSLLPLSFLAGGSFRSVSFSLKLFDGFGQPVEFGFQFSQLGLSGPVEVLCELRDRLRLADFLEHLLSEVSGRLFRLLYQLENGLFAVRSAELTSLDEVIDDLLGLAFVTSNRPRWVCT